MLSLEHVVPQVTRNTSCFVPREGHPSMVYLMVSILGLHVIIGSTEHKFLQSADPRPMERVC